MENSLWNNASQWHRIGYRFYPYLKITYDTALKRVNLARIITSRFPFYFSDNKKPASLSLELTDACDLKCLYCNNPFFQNPRKFMKDNVFTNLIKSLNQFKLDRIRVGGGEPTLHPKFGKYSEDLKSTTKYLSIVTNGQWKKEKIFSALLANYDLIEISIDCGGEKMYETSRPGASYDLLINNLKKLNSLKKEMKSNSIINLRLMIRPSTASNKHQEYSFWRKYCNTIMIQHVIYHEDSQYNDDVYNSVYAAKNHFPKCTLPFKDLQVRANGEIPLCQVTGSSIGNKKRMIIGNILNRNLKQIWTGNEIKKIRTAHRKRDFSNMEICKGCNGY